MLVITRKSPVHSALALILTLLCLAGLYLMLYAPFVAGVQIILYVGGIMVLFLFVIMLVNVGAEEEGRAAIFNRTPQVTAALIFSLLLVLGLLLAINRGYKGLPKAETPEAVLTARQAQQQNLPPNATGVSRLTKETERVGLSLYTYAALPFEIASVLLLVAIIGSVMLARTLKQEISTDDVDPEMLTKASASESTVAVVE